MGTAVVPCFPTPPTAPWVVCLHVCVCAVARPRDKGWGVGCTICSHPSPTQCPSGTPHAPLRAKHADAMPPPPLPLPPLHFLHATPPPMPFQNIRRKLPPSLAGAGGGGGGGGSGSGAHEAALATAAAAGRGAKHVLDDAERSDGGSPVEDAVPRPRGESAGGSGGEACKPEPPGPRPAGGSSGTKADSGTKSDSGVAEGEGSGSGRGGEGGGGSGCRDGSESAALPTVRTLWSLLPECWSRSINTAPPPPSTHPTHTLRFCTVVSGLRKACDQCSRGWGRGKCSTALGPCPPAPTLPPRHCPGPCLRYQHRARGAASRAGTRQRAPASDRRHD